MTWKSELSVTEGSMGTRRKKRDVNAILLCNKKSPSAERTTLTFFCPFLQGGKNLKPYSHILTLEFDMAISISKEECKKKVQITQV